MFIIFTYLEVYATFWLTETKDKNLMLKVMKTYFWGTSETAEH